MTAIDDIIEGLSEAQRRAMQRIYWNEGLQKWFVRRFDEKGGKLTTAVRHDVIWRLVDKGLLGRRAPNPVLKLGLAVRKRLQEQSNDNQT